MYIRLRRSNALDKEVSRLQEYGEITVRGLSASVYFQLNLHVCATTRQA